MAMRREKKVKEQRFFGFEMSKQDLWPASFEEPFDYSKHC